MKKTSKPISHKFKIKLPVLIIILVFILGLTQLIITHRLATGGGKIRELEIKASRLEEKNEIIKQETNKLGSLRRISQEAGKLGFAPNNNLYHLTPEIPVAMNY